jgi:uncharacterized protein (TIGR04255 family)
MAKNTTSSLPDYHNPPINEVVFGIQFKPLNLKSPHIGFFWEKLTKEEYPEYKEMPTLPHIVEPFDSPNVLPSPFAIESFELPPLPRLFFINKIRNHLIQIQPDRFLQNWRKLRNEDNYPRYDNLFPQFVSSYELFKSFTIEQNLGELKPDQYELTYVNHIPRGEAWRSLKDIDKIFPEFQCKTEGRFLNEPEDVSWRKVFRLPDKKGRLHVSLQLATSKELKDQIMVFNLTVRGFAPDNMSEWFGMAHEAIVRGFADLTNDTIQSTIWKRK